jgi:hypothetical protein
MLIIFGLHHYEKCTKNVFLICLVNFQNCHYGFKAYHRTDMNSDAPYESAVRTSQIAFHG